MAAPSACRITACGRTFFDSSESSLQCPPCRHERSDEEEDEERKARKRKHKDKKEKKDKKDRSRSRSTSTAPHDAKMAE